MKFVVGVVAFLFHYREAFGGFLGRRYVDPRL